MNSSVSTVSNIAMATLTASVSQEQQFSKWCWSTLSRLRLHLMDRTQREYDLVLAQKPDMFKVIIALFFGGIK